MPRSLKSSIGFCSVLFSVGVVLWTPGHAQVVLSEIMFNPPESEYYEEFIELYNPSLLDTIDLQGYCLGDQIEQDSLIETDGDLLLSPRAYALILDPGYWDNSAVYDTVISPNALILTIADNAFGAYGLRNNPPDTVILKNPAGETVAFFSYCSDNEDGYSEEKIRLDGGDETVNWANSMTCLGTPGYNNSVQPPEIDLAVVGIQVSPSPLPFGSSPVISALLSNRGLQTISGAEVIFAMGYIETTAPDTILGSQTIPDLLPADSAEITFFSEPLPPGPHRIYTWHTLQDDLFADDSMSVVLYGGYPEKSLIFNEIFPTPAEGQCEWVELYNPGEMDVSLTGFAFSDQDTSNGVTLVDFSLKVSQGNFVLLAADSNVFDFSMPEGACVVVMENGWPTLNNDGDTPTLFDAADGFQDAVPYTGWEILSGISLERLSAAGSSDDPANWVPSCDSTGGTPGRPNSMQTVPPSQRSSGSLGLSPDPFDPDRETLQIKIILPLDAASAAVIVFDLRGRKLKVLFDAEAPSGQKEISWDGRDMDNRRLPPGLYVMFAEFRDSSGKRKDVAKETLVIAGRL